MIPNTSLHYEWRCLRSMRTFAMATRPIGHTDSRGELLREVVDPDFRDEAFAAFDKNRCEAGPGSA